MILQDPQTSLNPVFSVGEQLREAIFRRTRGSKAEIMKEAVGGAPAGRDRGARPSASVSFRTR